MWTTSDALCGLSSRFPAEIVRGRGDALVDRLAVLLARNLSHQRCRAGAGEPRPSGHGLVRYAELSGRARIHGFWLVSPHPRAVERSRDRTRADRAARPALGVAPDGELPVVCGNGVTARTDPLPRTVRRDPHIRHVPGHH